MASVPKGKCAKKPLHITFPKTHPDKLASDYKESQVMSKMDKLYPEFDVVRQDDPHSTLAALQINLRQTEKLLRQKRRSHAKAKKDLNEQWMELANKEKTLRDNFLHFNLFVRENMEKRERASNKISDDKALLEQRQSEIDRLQENYNEIQKAKVAMDAKIRQYHCYEVYLDEVVEHSGEFQNIQELINRYLSLLSARNQLTQFQEENLVDLENARTDMMKIIEEKNLVIMGLNNQIASLQARFENANIKSLECEQLVTRIKNSAVHIMNEIDEVKSSLWNVYVHMAQSKKHPVKIKKDNVEEQALYIKRTLTELSKINNILRKPGKLSKMKTKST
ncbi:hypothetical protein NQ315_015282 [Exocentrus adspersus]|uniref:DUF4200 domain-containing protein n=1 Tax=Exocentrus adspersus TaxID=1586481 RepID=A0AAV8VAP4_9CUCU|nr:hypothetical protein NQ315_015282 [Exocentrus adspersus]